MKKKYNHNKADFVEALNLDKGELFDIAMKGFDMHFTQGIPLSKCILEIVETLKASSADEVKIFSVGMIFLQMLSMAENDEHLCPVHKKAARKNTDGYSDTLPFTSADLLKSIRDEMKNEKPKSPKDVGSN